MNLGGAKTTAGVAAVVQDDYDNVDPHLERIKNETGGDDSDEEVKFLILTLSSFFGSFLGNSLNQGHICKFLGWVIGRANKQFI